MSEKIVKFFSDTMNAVGLCDQCGRDDQVGYADACSREFYCSDCWLYDELKNTRCFSFARIYDMETGKALAIGASRVGVGCAERQVCSTP
jgi:hypothetical protein